MRDALVRIVLDFTGLHVTRSHMQTGAVEGQTVLDAGKSRLSFGVEVAEPPALRDSAIKLTFEHECFAWASEEEIQNDVFPLSWPTQKEVLLEAFKLRKDLVEKERLKALDSLACCRAMRRDRPRYTWS